MDTDVWIVFSFELAVGNHVNHARFRQKQGGILGIASEERLVEQVRVRSEDVWRTGDPNAAAPARRVATVGHYGGSVFEDQGSRVAHTRAVPAAWPSR